MIPCRSRILGHIWAYCLKGHGVAVQGPAAWGSQIVTL